MCACDYDISSIFYFLAKTKYIQWKCINVFVNIIGTICFLEKTIILDTDLICFSSGGGRFTQIGV